MNLEQFSDNQKHIINRCIEMGFDPSSFAKPEIDCFKMQLAFHAIRNGNDLTPYLADFDHDQLEQIRDGLRTKVDVSKYAKVELSGDEMMHKKKCLQYNLAKGIQDE